MTGVGDQEKMHELISVLELKLKLKTIQETKSDRGRELSSTLPLVMIVYMALAHTTLIFVFHSVAYVLIEELECLR